MTHDDKERYGGASVRRGLVRFIAGKGLSAAAGVLTLLLIVRALSVEAFAAYAALGAFTEVFTALAGVGLPHILNRYIPELYAAHLDHSLRRLVAWSLGLRSLTLVALIALVYGTAAPVSAFFGLGSWTDAFRLFLAVVFVRVGLQTAIQVLETMLMQGAVQACWVTTGFIKLAVVSVFFYRDGLDLRTLILTELFTDGLGLVLAAAFTGRHLLALPFAPLPEDTGWLRRNIRRMARFGVAGYGQHLAIMLYGSSPNRLVGSRYLGPVPMASLGFAQSLADTIRRYLPVQLFSGLVRPVLLAAYSRNRDFDELVGRANLVLKANYILLGVPLTLLLVAGDQVMLLLSGEKAGMLAAWLLVGFLTVMALESLRVMLDIMAQAVERLDILFYSNIVLSGSLFIAIPLIPSLGAAAIAGANIFGMLAANSLTINRLGREGYRYRHDWPGIGRIAAALLASVLCGRAMLYAGISPGAAAACALVLYGVLMVLLRSLNEKELLLIYGLRGQHSQKG